MEEEIDIVDDIEALGEKKEFAFFYPKVGKVNSEIV